LSWLDTTALVATLPGSPSTIGQPVPQRSPPIRRAIRERTIRAIGQGRVNLCTYDRDEVMTLAERIGVMRAGKIEDRLADNDLFGSSCSATSTASSVDFFVWRLLNLVQVAPVPPRAPTIGAGSGRSGRRRMRPP
jgi:hypothetical protein